MRASEPGLEIVRAESMDEVARGGWERQERRAKNRSWEKVYTPSQEEYEKDKEGGGAKETTRSFHPRAESVRTWGSAARSLALRAPLVPSTLPSGQPRWGWCQAFVCSVVAAFVWSGIGLLVKRVLPLITRSTRKPC